MDLSRDRTCRESRTRDRAPDTKEQGRPQTGPSYSNTPHRRSTMFYQVGRGTMHSCRVIYRVTEKSESVKWTGEI